MAIYGWDASHYDGTLTTATLVQAAAEGIEFFTHKLGEGATHADDDSTQTTALAAARDAGIKVIGGYWFGHNGDNPAAEADVCIVTADQHEPWWRTFPGWFWQADCETESAFGKPSPAWIRAFCDRLASTTGRAVIVYASHGQYGDSLTGLPYHLWNANYPSSAQAPFKALYPGDSYAGWTPYSGQTPALCQYASTATIAGLTTCDANAYRGTIDQLLALIGASPTQGGDTSMMIATENATSTNLYLCDGMSSRRITSADAVDIKYLAKQGLCSLALRPTPYNAAEWKDDTVRLGWTEGRFGPLVSPGGGSVPTPIDLAAVAKAVNDDVSRRMAQ